MKNFKLDQHGDVVVTGRNIVMVDGNELLRQKVESVLKTNKGEWFLNEDEGINFKAILKKLPDFDEIRSEISDGLRQVDETFMIEQYEYEMDGRTLKIKFQARNNADEVVEGEVDY